MTDVAQQTGREKTAIRPFHGHVPEADLTDLRQRSNATKWPERETVTEPSQGVPLATRQALARYGGTEDDGRTGEATLNALPQFLTEIEGLDHHFIHVRSHHDPALPLIVTHAWPGSVSEQLKSLDPLTNPTAHGASASDAFPLVIASLPGYGFSAQPTTAGWDPARLARAWVVLMTRTGWAESPVGLAALMLDHDARSYELIAHAFDGPPGGLTRDDVLDNSTLCGLTHTAISSARLDWEHKFSYFNAKNVSIPAAVRVVPDERDQAPRRWTEQAYPQRIYYMTSLRT